MNIDNELVIKEIYLTINPRGWKTLAGINRAWKKIGQFLFFHCLEEGEREDLVCAWSMMQRRSHSSSHCAITVDLILEPIKKGHSHCFSLLSEQYSVSHEQFIKLVGFSLATTLGSRETPSLRLLSKDISFLSVILFFVLYCAPSNQVLRFVRSLLLLPAYRDSWNGYFQQEKEDESDMYRYEIAANAPSFLNSYTCSTDRYSTDSFSLFALACAHCNVPLLVWINNYMLATGENVVSITKCSNSMICLQRIVSVVIHKMDTALFRYITEEWLESQCAALGKTLFEFLEFFFNNENHRLTQIIILCCNTRKRLVFYHHFLNMLDQLKPNVTMRWPDASTRKYQILDRIFYVPLSKRYNLETDVVSAKLSETTNLLQHLRWIDYDESFCYLFFLGKCGNHVALHYLLSLDDAMKENSSAPTYLLHFFFGACSTAHLEALHWLFAVEQREYYGDPLIQIFKKYPILHRTALQQLVLCKRRIADHDGREEEEEKVEAWYERKRKCIEEILLPIVGDFRKFGTGYSIHSTMIYKEMNALHDMGTLATPIPIPPSKRSIFECALLTTPWNAEFFSWFFRLFVNGGEVEHRLFWIDMDDAVLRLLLLSTNFGRNTDAASPFIWVLHHGRIPRDFLLNSLGAFVEGMRTKKKWNNYEHSDDISICVRVLAQVQSIYKFKRLEMLQSGHESLQPVVFWKIMHRVCTFRDLSLLLRIFPGILDVLPGWR